VIASVVEKQSVHSSGRPVAAMHPRFRPTTSLSTLRNGRYPRAAVRARHSQFVGPPRRRIWRSALQGRPRSADRTRSPAAVSRKREFFKYTPETIGYLAPRMSKTGARRLVPNSRKPAIGGPFYSYHRHFL
jgi:hypothetical protein